MKVRALVAAVSVAVSVGAPMSPVDPSGDRSMLVGRAILPAIL